MITGAPDFILKDHEQFCMFEHGKYICFKFYCSSCSQRLKFVQIIFCLTNRKNKVFDNSLRIKFASFLTFHAYRLPKFEGCKLLCYKVRLANLS